MTQPVQYMTVIEPVVEVTLYGTADGDFWRRYLNEQHLPVDSTDAKTDILISTVDARYMGIRFQELSISIKVRDGVYFLAHAYNSLALFALAERVFFKTPYYHASIVPEMRHIRLSHGQSTVFEAQLPDDARLIGKGEECNDVQIYLPKALRKNPTQPHFFYARLEGFTEIYAAEDAAVKIVPNPKDPILGLLNESNFQVHEWRTRAAARHSKSKTYWR
jgi:hypothetical protein